MRPARTILILARISLHSMCAQCSVSNVSRIQFRFVCTLHAHIMRELHTRDSYTTCSCIKPSITWNENSVALFSLSLSMRIALAFVFSHRSQKPDERTQKKTVYAILWGMKYKFTGLYVCVCADAICIWRMVRNPGIHVYTQHTEYGIHTHVLLFRSGVSVFPGPASDSSM